MEACQARVERYKLQPTSLGVSTGSGYSGEFGAVCSQYKGSGRGLAVEWGEPSPASAATGAVGRWVHRWSLIRGGKTARVQQQTV